MAVADVRDIVWTSLGSIRIGCLIVFVGGHASTSYFGNVYTLRTDGTLVQSIPMRLTDTGGVPSGLIQGRDGKLYGTASTGGFSPLEVPIAGGTVFVADPSGSAAEPALAPAPGPSQTGPVDEPAPQPVDVAQPTAVGMAQPVTLAGCSADYHEIQIDVEVKGTHNGVSAGDLLQDTFQTVTSGMPDDEFRQASGCRTVSLAIGRRILADGQADAVFSPDFDWRYAGSPNSDSVGLTAERPVESRYRLVVL